MNVLILTCSTGGGHNSAANALGAELEKLGHSYHVKNAFEFLPDGSNRFFTWGHVFLYRHLPKIYTRFYKLEESHPTEGIYKRYLKYSGTIKNYIEKHGFDCAVCVHVFPAFLLTAMRQRYKTSFKQYFIATDYTCSPTVEMTDMDAYFISKGLSGEFESRGLSVKKLVETGIPVSGRCYERPDKRSVKRELDMPEEKPLVLLTAGSMGCGDLEKIAGRILKERPSDCSLAVICGSNKSTYRQLSRKLKKHSGFRLLGFTDKMISWIQASDLVITKPGGLTTTETAACGTPLLLMDVVPGLETHNLQWFTSRNCAVAVKKDRPGKINNLASRLLANPEQLERISAAQRKLFSDNSARKIAEAITEADLMGGPDIQSSGDFQSSKELESTADFQDGEDFKVSEKLEGAAGADKSNMTDKTDAR